MRLFIILALVLLTTAPLRLTAQETTPGTLQGRVIDAETGDPLAGAHVFLAGSTLGATTDRDGRYRLAHLPPGRHEIAASMLGYEHQSQRLLLSATDTASLDFRLKPTVIALGEVFVAATQPEQWRRRLETFEQLFLGTTHNAERCTLLNPEVLDFTDDDGHLRAEASAPLLIENRALGYRVHYYLKEFEVVHGVLRYLGIPRFDELEPRNKRERRRWERQRRKTYEGSLQHFLATLFATGNIKDAKKAGFEVSVAPQFERDPSSTFPVRSGSLLRPAAEPHSRLLAFEDHLQVVYTPDVRLPAPSGFPGINSTSLDDYASWITLTDGPAEIDRFGHLFDPYAVTTYGRWSQERIAEILPREYQPSR